MATIRVTYCGMDGEGKTLTAAKQDAARKAEKALEGSYTPRMMRCKGEAAIVYREPSGWSYALIATEGRVRQDHTLCTQWCGDEDEAMASAAFHITQNAWDGEDGEALEALLNEAGLLGRGAGRRDKAAGIRSWAAWQLRYRAAAAQGMDRDQAWNMASHGSPLPLGAMQAVAS